MDDPNNTTGSDEDILTYTASDEALEAAAGMWGGAVFKLHCPFTSTIPMLT
jgi:hypothetical protein